MDRLTDRPAHPGQRMLRRASSGRLVSAGATMLGASVLLDSAMEHYRGSFHNVAMTLPLLASGLSIAGNGARAIRFSSPTGNSAARFALHGTSAAIGAVGLGFHAYNVLKRPGAVRLGNLFYGAPIGAPAALVLAGLLGAAGDELTRTRTAYARRDALSSSRTIGAITASGIFGTVAEAGLLHFRGAFHNPAMWLPIALPPVAALSMARDVARRAPHRLTLGLLVATAAMGIAGVGFHAFGIARNMGGWRNWRQNLLAGPPIPAPPAFTGLAIAAIGAFLLMRSELD